jgi:drug/metabolite transporter (DMT)-like permease
MLVLRTAELAGINFSLILNLYSLTPFLTAILFYLVFKERLAKAHILGMIFIFGCVVVTGESNSEQ